MRLAAFFCPIFGHSAVLRVGLGDFDNSCSGYSFMVNSKNK